MNRFLLQWLIDFWLLPATVMSVLWGMRAGAIHPDYGHRKWNYFYEFASNFVGSFAGWCCVYTLAVRIGSDVKSLGGFDFLLSLVAVIGVSGRLAETIHKFLDAIGTVVGAIAKKAG
jgi:hypothetical protein